ncbi:hypothetical protein [Thermofilum pendens]|uniref:Uncharacterized protein n=1 Tax=Thermofilum pendens (strain DSM 2475 / Hrk 5) TaxID=368408 RepID=A1RZF4_THEPD|nr:hypothetical protein [Thermofilum pendens]ABL78584.1 hypothetical protein Tpen_1186 [Thermofilum pendens Hrk 5]
MGEGGAGDEKFSERVLLLRRFLPQLDGPPPNAFRVKVLREVLGLGVLDQPKTIEEIARVVTDEQLKHMLMYSPYRGIYDFRGRYYTVRNGELLFEDSSGAVERAVHEAVRIHGLKAYAVLKALLDAHEAPFGYVAAKASEILGERVYPARILAELRDRWGLVWEAGDREEKLWKIPEEIRPFVAAALARYEAGGLRRFSTRQAEEEFLEVLRREEELDNYVRTLLRERLDEVLDFGEKFSVGELEGYLVDLFGRVVFFDELLTLAQQYSLADVDIVTEDGHKALSTGFNLALFGEPGTGKTFATKDFILGNEKLGVPPHGIPGINRYCGGMTPAMFIAIGEAYVGRRFNFIVTEFNDWFKYKGMVEPLKLAMEGGEIFYETRTYRVGPYKFDSFFSVNYNTHVFERGYEVTVKDPNFNAIEDRMLCRLHRLTKEKYRELAESQRRLMLGISTRKMAEMAPKIRDHLTLVYSVSTGRVRVEGVKRRKVLLTEKELEAVGEAREKVFEALGEVGVLPFSLRLERRALQLAAALSLANYLRGDEEVLPIDREALRLAVKFYVEEAWVRAQESFDLSEVLGKLGVS